MPNRIIGSSRPRGYTVAAGLGATALLLASCGSGSTAPPPSNAHKGGTLLIVTTSNPGSVDTAINYGTGWFELNITNDGLTAYQKVAGKAGTQLVPDLAAALPTVTDSGTTYTFHIRSGIHYSDGTLLKPSDFVNVFERMFKVMGPTTGPFYSGIVGAPACLAKPATCDLTQGIVADDAANTLIIHLLQPDGEFLDKLALPFAFAVPPSAPNTDAGTHPLPGTGPYMWAEYSANTEIKLVRNPYFHVWSTAAQPAGYPNTIIVKFGVPAESQVTEVENGQADWVASTTGLPSDRLAEISSSYPSQLHVSLATAIFYMALNVNVPPFNNQMVRQALNYATDRGALVKLFGGPKLAVPSCQILPPNFPGYVQYCPYTANAASNGAGAWTAPDLAKARQLVAQSGTAGQTVTIVNPNIPLGVSTGQYFEQLLNSLGYKAKLQLLAPQVQNPYAKDSSHKVQISLSIWYQDYQAASDFLNVLLGCGSFQANSGSQPNISEFCDQSIQAQMNQALAEGSTNRAAADTLWATVDHEMTDQAPMVVMYNPTNDDFVGKRVGNYEYNPQWGFLVDQAWVQ